MGYRAVIFDVDGTLVDSEKRGLLSLQRAIREITGKEYGMEELYFSQGLPGIVTMEMLGVDDAKGALQLWEQYFVEYKYMERIFEGIPLVLETLKKRGIPLGIATSRTKEQYRKEMDGYEIAGYFQEVVCADDTEHPKPAPDPLVEMAARLGVAPREMLYVGDSVYDMKCAASAGADGALALWGACEPERIEARWRLEKPEDILSF